MFEKRNKISRRVVLRCCRVCVHKQLFISFPWLDSLAKYHVQKDDEDGDDGYAGKSNAGDNCPESFPYVAGRLSETFIGICGRSADW